MVVQRNIEMTSSSSEASPSRQITVVDVYDLASAIGKDFERLIDQFGTECVRELMPKVISSLETLEALASRNDRENEDIVCLKKTVDRLEAEKEERKEGRAKFEQELEQIEENYRKEIQELWSMVSQLQEDNKRLSTSLDNHKDQQSPMTTSMRDDDLKVMLSLRGTVDSQRDQIKTFLRDNEDKEQELDSTNQQVEKLRRVNKELQRKYKAIQNQGRVLVEEKAELISQLQKCEVHLIELEHKLGETEKAKKDLEQTKAEEAQGENTPRFTLAELREVLQEKNTLKARVMELEEELELLRPVPTPSPQPPDKNEEEEYLVYGPINKEPEDKLYPWKYDRKDSGVRKFFSRLRKKTKSPARRRERENFNDLACASSSSVSFSKTAAETVHLCRDDIKSKLPIIQSEPCTAETSTPLLNVGPSVSRKSADCQELSGIYGKSDSVSIDEGLAETPIEFSLSSDGNFGQSSEGSPRSRSSSMAFDAVVKRLFPGSQVNSLDTDSSFG